MSSHEASGPTMRTFLRLVLAGLLPALVLPLSVLAAVPADTLRQVAPRPQGALPEQRLPAISVVATRLEADPAAAPARVTVLDAEALRATGARSVADVLEARTTALVRRYGPGALATLSLRGTTASQTLVLLDGHRIANPQLGQLDHSLLPTILLERVEVLHGAGSALHGTDAVGGAVDLRTLRPERRGLDLEATAGAFGEQRLAARVATVGRGVRAVAAVEGLAEENDFPYTDPLRGDGERRRRTGADRTMVSAFGRVETELGPRTTAHLALWGGRAERGVPGSIGAPSPARQEDRHVRLWGGATTRLAGGASLRTGGLVQFAALRYEQSEGRTWIGSADAEVRVPAGRWRLSAGATAGFGTADHPSLAADAREARLGVFAAATGDLGPLLLYPALRTDVYLRTEGGALAALAPRLGANLQPAPALPLRLKASAGAAFRAPTFNDRFWRYADPEVPAGDPALRPERGWTADAGAVADLGPLRAEVTAFAAWLRDQIVWLPTEAGPFAPRNVGRTRTRGLEATAEAAGLRLGRATASAGLTYALTDARDRSDPASAAFGRPLLFVPRHQLKGHASADLALDARTRLRLDLGARRVGERPITADGSFVDPAYAVADAQLALTRVFDAATVALSLHVENALDADYYVLRGYPMPPRHARLRLRLSL